MHTKITPALSWSLIIMATIASSLVVSSFIVSDQSFAPIISTSTNAVKSVRMRVVETDNTVFIAGPSVSADQSIDGTDVIATTSDGSDSTSLVAAVGDATQSQTRSFTVNYSQPLDSLLSATNISDTNINPNIIAGVFPMVQGGTQTLSAQLISPADILSNYPKLSDYTSSSTRGVAARMAYSNAVNAFTKNISCQQFLSSIQSAGYRPLNLQEGLSLIAQGNGLGGGAFLGSVLNVTGVSVTSDTVQGIGASGNVTYYGNDTKALASKSAAGSLYAYPTSSLGLQMTKSCITSFLAIQASSTGAISVPSIAQLPISIKMSSIGGQAKVIVSPTKYTVSVNYDQNIANQQNTPTITGTKNATIQLVHIYGGGQKLTNSLVNLGGILWISQDQAKSAIAAQLPGYRPALENEMVALEAQYPQAVGRSTGSRSNMMAFGTWNPKCKDYPWMFMNGVSGATLYEKAMGDQGLSFATPITSVDSKNYTSSLRVLPSDYWVFPVVKI